MENNYDKFQEEDFLSGEDKKNSFALPEDYFNSFSKRMLNRIEHEQELAEFKTLAAVNRQLKFDVPQNYFASLADILEYKYELSVYPEINKIAKPALKQLPVDYFEELDKKITAKIELTSELEEFAVLSSIEKKNNFKLVPEYFEDSAYEVKEKIHTAKHRAIGIFEQIASILFKPKMAFALSFVLIIGLTSVWYFNKKESTVKSGDCKTLACLEKNELLNENTVRDFDDENLYDMVDADMLDKKISSENAVNDSIKTNLNKIK